jgi:hypothetical protein
MAETTPPHFLKNSLPKRYIAIPEKMKAKAKVIFTVSTNENCTTLKTCPIKYGRGG